MNSVSNFVAAFGAAALGFAGTAQADFIVRIDNQLDPSGYADAKTTNTIKICALTKAVTNAKTTAIDAWYCVSRVVHQVSYANDFYFDTAGTNDVGQISRLEVSINGTDMFIVDKLRTLAGFTFEGIPKVMYESGVDNEIGYCLSQDPADFTNAHCTASSNGAILMWNPPITPYIW
jgi:hypothetical protein